MRAHVFRDGTIPSRTVKKNKYPTSVSFAWQFLSHVYLYTHGFPSIVVFIILLQEEERVHKRSDSQRGKESWGGGWARNYSQSQSIGNWKRTKERNILLTEARKIKIIMELRFLMTGSWWPPAQVRVVQEPTGSSSVHRRAWSYN